MKTQRSGSHKIPGFLTRKRNLLRGNQNCKFFNLNIFVYIDSLLDLSQIFNSVLFALIRLIQI